MWESQRDFQRVWEGWTSRLYGFPRIPYSVISIASFGNAYSKNTVTTKGRFRRQEPLVRDGSAARSTSAPVQNADDTELLTIPKRFR
jgi:hypothetical protein